MTISIENIRYHSSLLRSMIFHRRSRHLRLGKKPIVSFTFDDIPATAKTGADMLRDAGFRGTFYVCAGLLGTAGPQGRIIDPGALLELASEGHEIGCHTHSHLRAAETDPDIYGRDIEKNRDILQDVYSILPASFAFPYGSVTEQVKKIAGSLYPSCRTTVPGIHYGKLDASFLRANRLYGERFTEAHARLIAVCVRKAGWLIFYTHDICKTPSPWGCRPDVLQSAIEAALSSGCDIRTVGEVINGLH